MATFGNTLFDQTIKKYYEKKRKKYGWTFKVSIRKSNQQYYKTSIILQDNKYF